MKIRHCPTFKLPSGSLRPPTLSEEEGFSDPVSKWWGKFKDEYGSVRDSWGPDLANMDRMRVEELFRGMFPEDIKSRLRFVGVGSKRIAFVSDANICYKFQYNDFGNQNRQEILEGLAHPGLRCFTKLLGHSKDGLTLACETAEQPTLGRFIETFTQSPSWMTDRLCEYGRTGESRMLDMMLDADILNGPQTEAVRDLMGFQREIWTTQRNMLQDLDHVDNWGLTFREGLPVILVTDYGL